MLSMKLKLFESHGIPLPGQRSAIDAEQGRKYYVIRGYGYIRRVYCRAVSVTVTSAANLLVRTRRLSAPQIVNPVELSASGRRVSVRRLSS